MFTLPTNTLTPLLIALLVIIAAFHIFDWLFARITMDAKTKTVVGLIYGIIVTVATLIAAGMISL